MKVGVGGWYGDDGGADRLDTTSERPIRVVAYILMKAIDHVVVKYDPQHLSTYLSYPSRVLTNLEKEGFPTTGDSANIRRESL